MKRVNIAFLIAICLVSSGAMALEKNQTPPEVKPSEAKPSSGAVENVHETGINAPAPQKAAVPAPDHGGVKREIEPPVNPLDRKLPSSDDAEPGDAKIWYRGLSTVLFDLNEKEPRACETELRGGIAMTSASHLCVCAPDLGWIDLVSRQPCDWTAVERAPPPQTERGSTDPSR